MQNGRENIMKEKQHFLPIDTASIVNTRSRIRLCSTLSILLTFLYFFIEEYFTGAHVSYLHLFHFFIQPFIFLASMVDLYTLPNITIYVHSGTFFMDFFGFQDSGILRKWCAPKFRADR